MLENLLPYIKSNKAMTYTILLLLEINKDEYSIVPEMINTMDEITFFKFAYVYGGQKIRIPTLQEIEEVMKEFLIYYLREIEYHEWKGIQKIFEEKHLGVFKAKSLSPRIRHLNRMLEKNQIDIRQILHYLNGKEDVENPKEMLYNLIFTIREKSSDKKDVHEDK